ncbi:MAG: hypothetical protein A3E82_08190 [Gammaproteobacteria bacterium RIFCSPHIGHO2_12_FULL_38_11]|nr:MAG: hypothetical protein A3E82_08190 [Gammaproteobacteria bacterium RIFCSPHIGHO2_12_FULL_38_11]
MLRTLLRTIILEWQTPKVVKPDVSRVLTINLDTMLNNEHIVLLTGVRRCGKSTLLQHIRQQHNEKHYYLNFEDERLIDFTVDHFQMMMEIFAELFGEEKTFYFDEIQNIKGWERFVRRLYEQGYKIFITGSNAKMLSQEMGTHLTGRYIKIELYPFSFCEFLDFKGVKINVQHATTAVKAKLNNLIKQYITVGGFPQYVKDEMLEYLQALYESILYRDIISRYKLPSETAIRQLAFYFASNVGKEITYNSLKKQLNLGCANTAAEYCQYLENCYLFFLVKRFSYSLKQQSNSPKKVYAIDSGLAHAIGFRSSQDAGRMLENIVFIELKRRNFEIYYHHEKKECDFVVCKKNKIQALIQVCFDLGDLETKEREINGIIDAMQTYKIKQGTIITLTEADEMIVTVDAKKYRIDIVPIWLWLVAVQK